jgi:hypothetical protein
MVQLAWPSHLVLMAASISIVLLHSPTGPGHRVSDGRVYVALLIAIVPLEHWIVTGAAESHTLAVVPSLTACTRQQDMRSQNYRQLANVLLCISVMMMQ